jgi:uncharacterized membrane-anchored protein YjiN (DUF445 family)
MKTGRRPAAAADRTVDLARAKRRALLLLLAAAALFLLTLVLPSNAWVLGLRACTEAALVGGLADWFAVSALFRRIPTGVPYFTRHTDVLARNKDRIAVNLASFIEEKFLDAESLAALIRRNDPAARAAQWLGSPANQERLSHHVLVTVAAAIRLVDEEHVRRAIRDAAQAAVGKVDLSGTAAGVLKTLTDQGRHQALLERTLGQLLGVLESETTRAAIAKGIVDWIRSDHPLKEKILPTEWLGDNAAALVARAVGRLLEQVQANPAHELRQGFDAAVEALVLRLQEDPVVRRKGEEIRQYLLEDEAFGAYLDSLWASWRDWVLADLSAPGSVLHGKVREACGWLGRRLAEDPQLRAELDTHLEEAARGAAPEFAHFLTTHIRDTIERWDTRDMAREVELSIGRDLQSIRISGTFVGGVIGLVLYLLSLIASSLPAS